LIVLRAFRPASSNSSRPLAMFRLSGNASLPVRPGKTSVRFYSAYSIVSVARCWITDKRVIRAAWNESEDSFAAVAISQTEFPVGSLSISRTRGDLQGTRSVLRTETLSGRRLERSNVKCRRLSRACIWPVCGIAQRTPRNPLSFPQRARPLKEVGLTVDRS